MNLSTSEATQATEQTVQPTTDAARLPMPQERREVTGAAPVTRLLQRFQRESARYRRRLRSAIRLVIAGAVLSTVLNAIAIALTVRRGVEHLPFGFMVALWLLYGATLCAVPIPVFRARIARDRLRDRLSGYDDIRVIGPLAEMLLASDPTLRGAAIEGLIRLLPRLRRAEAELLNAEQRDCLCSVLRVARREETDLAVAVLQALAEIGGSDELPLVERLAETVGHTRRQRAVRAAAVAALPRLREHSRQEQASRTLLRSSGANAGPESLLRPAAGTDDADTTQLLRPTDSL